MMETIGVDAVMGMADGVRRARALRSPRGPHSPKTLDEMFASADYRAENATRFALRSSDP
jgi:hypothetical protein